MYGPSPRSASQPNGQRGQVGKRAGALERRLREYEI
jgi:hypothetical protein